jgi:outer membrane receptor protein involved in Fe transport
VTWTLGVSVDDYDQEELEVSKGNPKLGVQWQVTDDLRLRGAAFRTLSPALVTNQTIEPTQVAGFNQFFDDPKGTESWRYGVGIDWRLMDGFFLGGEMSWRDLTVPFFVNGDAQTESQEERLHRVYLFWTPRPELALSAELVYDRIEAEEGRFTDSTALGFPEDLEKLRNGRTH